MYIIVEGMPGTGKSTIAKALAKRLNCEYRKSSLSNNAYGYGIREVINGGNNAEDVEYLYLIDLLFDELEIEKKVQEGKTIVRDKCYVSNYSYMKIFDCAVKDEKCSKLVLTAYDKIRTQSHKPDVVVYLEPDFKKILASVDKKQDTSEWDKYIISHKEQYLAQERVMKSDLKAMYGNQMLTVRAFAKDVDGMVEDIVKQIKQSNKMRVNSGDLEK